MVRTGLASAAELRCLSRCGGRISRPTMSSAIAASDSPCAGRVEIRRPWRRTVILSATAFASLSLWVMKRIALLCGFQLADDPEELVHLRRGQHGCRFVENEQAGVEAERFKDFDPLPLADREPRHRRIWVEIEPIMPDQRFRSRAHGRPVGNEAEHSRLAVEIEVLRHASSRNELEVLVYHADAGASRVRRIGETSRSAVECGFRPRRAG